MEPGIDATQDPFAVACELLKAAQDEWLLDHADNGRNELIHAYLLVLAELVSIVYNTDQRETWQAFQHFLNQFLNQRRTP